VRVQILIDEEGRPSVERVLESTHQEAVQPVRQAFARMLFDVPTKDGQPVRARYIIPIGYDYSQ